MKKKELKKLKPKEFLSDFKAFIFKGNFGDVITGMVIATALTTLVRSLINDIATPFVRYFIGDMDFTGLKIPLNPDSPPTEIIYVDLGLFIQNVVNFLVLALMFFILAKIWSKAFKKKEEEATEEINLLRSINEKLERMESLNNTQPDTQTFEEDIAPSNKEDTKKTDYTA